MPVGASRFIFALVASEPHRTSKFAKGGGSAREPPAGADARTPAPPATGASQLQLTEKQLGLLAHVSSRKYPVGEPLVGGLIREETARRGVAKYGERLRDSRMLFVPDPGEGGEKGTPADMAPELLDANTFTEETDVYAYALVIWEVLTGDIPWRGLNPVQVAMQILPKQARPAVPEGAPADLVALMVRGWAHEPNARPTFAAIKAELLGGGPETPAK